jgi:hypothetical protein
LLLLVTQRLLQPFLFLTPLLAGHFAGNGRLRATALVLSRCGSAGTQLRLCALPAGLVVAALGRLFASVDCRSCACSVAPPASAGAQPRDAASPVGRTAAVVSNARALSCRR